VSAYTQLALWCRRGHELTDDNTYPGRAGEPLCRECLRLHLAAVRRWHQTKADNASPAEEGTTA
jgi:hypothetical protein